MTAAQVTDIRGRFVADPFMIKVDGVWHMFFEVMNDATNKGEIGLATSRDERTWQYQRIVLEEPFHLSYPCVFQWNDDFYMIPETLGSGSIRLYRAAPFPNKWVHVLDLFSGRHADPSIFQFNGKWWMFTCPAPHDHDILNLYYAHAPTAGWTAHPCNPIVSGNRRTARPGGRVTVCDGKLIRFAQDCYPTYGNRVRAFEITAITPDTYKEREVAESPVLSPSGEGWNAGGMHHIDPQPGNSAAWLACVDGVAGT